MNSESKNILIVDDDVDCLDQMKLIVESMGYTTITAMNQKQGEKLLEEQKPDLAIFDLMMENKDSGFILSYKSKKKYPEVPVIIATAVTAETGMIFGLETAEARKWIKADHYMEKSIRPDQLQQTIKRLLKTQ
jgi:DNA-binding response OmpR family regulator